jgi:hypothetical protein
VRGHDFLVFFVRSSGFALLPFIFEADAFGDSDPEGLSDPEPLSDPDPEAGGSSTWTGGGSCRFLCVLMRACPMPSAAELKPFFPAISAARRCISGDRVTLNGSRMFLVLI